MQFYPLPHYFIVKIEIEKQKNKREKIGSLYTHFAEVYMQRNMQYGEIVAIGSMAADIFPQAKVSNTLIFHHFVEGQNSEKSNFIHSDESFNYYYVTAKEYNGHRNECYAVFDGTKIIPHPEFVFIEHEEKPKEVSADNFIEQNTTKVGNLILFNNWEETREEREEKAQKLTTEIKNQSKGKSMTDSTKRALEEKQVEAGNITASLNKKEYKPKKIYAYNPLLQKSYVGNIASKENIYSLSIASETEIEFMDKKYFVIQTKYCAAIA